jgi:hypothetical protein
MQRHQTGSIPIAASQPKLEKPVDNENKVLDIASYKLYYVNYEIGNQRSFHRSPLTKDLTNRALCPVGRLPQVTTESA